MEILTNPGNRRGEEPSSAGLHDLPCETGKLGKLGKAKALRRGLEEAEAD
jgi:hypothetical protein